MDRESLNCGVDQVVDELFDTDNELPVSYYQFTSLKSFSPDFHFNLQN